MPGQFSARNFVLMVINPVVLLKFIDVVRQRVKHGIRLLPKERKINLFHAKAATNFQQKTPNAPGCSRCFDYNVPTYLPANACETRDSLHAASSAAAKAAGINLNGAKTPQ